MPVEVFARVLDRVVHPQGRRLASTKTSSPGCDALVLVRHGHASGGWDDDRDPGLDDVGRAQAEAMADLVAPRVPLPILVSPLRRCRETAAPLERRWATVGTVDPAVGEIPTPPEVPLQERTTWLHAAMAGTWADIGAEYTAGATPSSAAARDRDRHRRRQPLCRNQRRDRLGHGPDQIIVAVLDYCSQTVMDVVDGQLVLVEQGFEAPDTLVR
jgi:hypothetical protein